MITIHVVLGRENRIYGLPWIPNLAVSEKHYIRQTKGNVVILSYKMWELFSKQEKIFNEAKPVFVFGKGKVPLPELPKDASHFENIIHAISPYYGLKNTEIFVLGGTEFFESLIRDSAVKRIFITRIDEDLESPMTFDKGLLSSFRQYYEDTWRERTNEVSAVEFQVWAK